MATEQERLDLEKIFPIGSWVKVTPNPQVSSRRGDFPLRDTAKRHIAGKTGQVAQINGRLIQVEVKSDTTEQSDFAWAMPDWLIRTDAPKAPLRKIPAFQQYLDEVRSTNAKRDNNLREAFGIATPAPMDFKTDEVCLISLDAKTASGKKHMYAGTRIWVKNTYRNQAGLWAANVEPCMGPFGGKPQATSVLMKFMKKV